MSLYLYDPVTLQFCSVGFEIYICTACTHESCITILGSLRRASFHWWCNTSRAPRSCFMSRIAFMETFLEENSDSKWSASKNLRAKPEDRGHVMATKASDWLTDGSHVIRGDQWQLRLISLITQVRLWFLQHFERLSNARRPCTPCILRAAFSSWSWRKWKNAGYFHNILIQRCVCLL